MPNFWDNKKIVLTGGAGFLGSFISEKLLERGVKKEDILIPRSKTHDLRERAVCEEVVKGKDIVIHCAVTGGGIGFHRQYPGRVYFDNIIMNTELLEASRKHGVEKFVGIGTVCAYPKIAPIPFREEDLWIGYPEETNGVYGMAKKMMFVQGDAYFKEYNYPSVHLLLENMYGPRDDFDPESSHVIPALIRKIYLAKKTNEPTVVVWGTGNATRGFLYVEDAAEAILRAAEHVNDPTPLNIGSGEEISIKDLVNLIVELMEYEGEIVWDKEKPDGQPRRAIDSSKAQNIIGEFSKTNFRTGLKKTIDWFEKNLAPNLK